MTKATELTHPLLGEQQHLKISTSNLGNKDQVQSPFASTPQSVSNTMHDIQHNEARNDLKEPPTFRQPMGKSEMRFYIQILFLSLFVFLQAYLIGNTLNASNYRHPTAIIRISYSRGNLNSQTASAVADVGSYKFSNILEQAISDIKNLRSDISGADTDNNENTIDRQAALKSIFEADEHSGKILDSSVLCESMAIQEAKSTKPANNGALGSHSYFEDDELDFVDSKTVLLSTYFNSKTDPYHCWKYENGQVSADNIHYLRSLLDAVERLGMTVVLFHDGALSDSFMAQISTPGLLFQKVKLQESSNVESLSDERWRIFRDWLNSPAAANVEWVLAAEPTGWTLAKDPFALMQSNKIGSFGLWTEAYPAKPRSLSRFYRCYGDQNNDDSEEDAWYLDTLKARKSIEENELTFDPGMIGGSRAIFQELATTMAAELETMPQGWSCEGPALHQILRDNSNVQQSEQLQQARVFASGHPFIGSIDHCLNDGLCDYAIFRESQ